MTGLSINHYLAPPGYPLSRFLDDCVAAGATGVGLTEHALDEAALPDLRRMLRVSSVNSAGFFLWAEPDRVARQREANARLIEAAAELAAETLVTIGGGLHDAGPDAPGALPRARQAVEDALPALIQAARSSGVRLGIEAMHPIRIVTKATLNTLAQAEALCIRHPDLGVVVDAFHSWWDPDLEPVLARIVDRIRLVQLCGVKQPLDPAQAPRRCPMREGAADLAGLIDHLGRCGYRGGYEFEVFAQDLDGQTVPEAARQAAADFTILRGTI